MNEFWTYKLIGGRCSQVFKIDECGKFLSIHLAAQVLIDRRGYTIGQAYEHLNSLQHV